MSANYTAISIIYNPNSTGSGKQHALDLQESLQDTPYAKLVKIVPTEYAGHAEKLAYELACTGDRPLIISASGDGGYHEVVNGIMRANSEGHHATSGLLPAGNANDHYHNLHTIPLEERILGGKEASIDLLSIETSGSEPWQRYAHSYIGLGLTPKVGIELNKVDLNRLNEIWIVLRTLRHLRPTYIEVDGQRRAYDSLVFSNVERMSKVLNLADTAELTDGKFEVTGFRTRNKFKLIRSLVKAATTGLDGKTQVSEYTFRSIKPTKVQLDGEIYTIPARSDVTVKIIPRALACVV